MSPNLRSFLNSDTPHLTRIWNRHFEASRVPVTVSPGAFDACVMSKPFFCSEDLWLYEEDGHPLAFAHVGYGGNAAGDALDRSRPLICALCVEPHPKEDLIADQLLTMILEKLRQQPVRDVVMIGSPERCSFYLGMAPGDALMGVVARDYRLQRWIARHAFEAIRPTECWEVDLAGFRPPMDRSQFALRRSTSVVRVLEERHRTWWEAVVLGHTEQIRFQLLTHQQAKVHESIDFWFIDMSIAGIASNTVRLWMPNFPDDTEGRDRVTYLLSEAFRQLQSERFSTVRAIASADQAASVAIFQRLGLRSVETGLVFKHPCHPA